MLESARRHPARPIAVLLPAAAVVTALLTSSPTRAQLNCTAQGLSGNACIAALQQYQALQSFQSLPNSAAGMAVMRADMAGVERIYLNATVAQQNQAATNSNLTLNSGSNPYNQMPPQQNVWGMLTPTNALYPSLSAFPQLVTSQALATRMYDEISQTIASSLSPTPAPPTAAVLGNINTTINIAASQIQVDALKSTFTAYAQAFAGQSTIYADPMQNDPRPFQISNIIALSLIHI